MAHSNQGGVKNYLGNQKMVKAPLHWQSAPNHPTTELAYITKKEKDLLIKKDLHKSLKGGVNRGPSGIMSLNGWGSKDSPGGPETGMSGAATSAAETGGGGGADRRELAAQYGSSQDPKLPPGVTPQLPQDALDYRAAAINAGAGQRVNPGFFDSRTRLSPAERAMAKTYRQDPNNRFAKQAYRNTGQGGLRGFIGGGGFFGNLLRGVGQKFGWGKRYNEPTYNMSQFSNYGLGGVPYGTLDEDEDEKISEVSFSPKSDRTYADKAKDFTPISSIYAGEGELINVGGTDGATKNIPASSVYADKAKDFTPISSIYGGENEFVNFNQGGRAGYRNGEFVDEDINIQGPGFDFNENIEMAEGESAFEMRIQELVDTGMSWQEAYEIAAQEFGMAEGQQDSFSEEGLASLV